MSMSGKKTNEELRRQIIEEAKKETKFVRMDKRVFNNSLALTLKEHKKTIEALADR